jgi:hypothetical protein
MFNPYNFAGLVPFCCFGRCKKRNFNSQFVRRLLLLRQLLTGTESKVPTTAAKISPVEKLGEGKHEGFFERTH